MLYLTEDQLEDVMTDDLGNRIHLPSGQFVVVVGPQSEKYTSIPTQLVNVDGEWLLKQMEFEFET